MSKTENAADVGKHKFEVAGLGLAPFRYPANLEYSTAMNINQVKPDVTRQTPALIERAIRRIRQCSAAILRLKGRMEGTWTARNAAE